MAQAQTNANKKYALITAVAIVIGVLAIASYRTYQMRTARGAIIALANDSAGHLRAALTAEVAGEPAGDLEAHTATAAAHLTKLRSTNTSALRPLADAVDDALLTTREIMRRQLDMQQARARLSTSLDALAEHIRSDRGSNNWTREAVRLKALVDKDFRDYRIAVEAYATLLASFPETQAKLAPHVAPVSALLIEDKLVSGARQHALEAYERTESNVKRISTLPAYRVGGMPR
jgi:hypothetical protein